MRYFQSLSGKSGILFSIFFLFFLSSCDFARNKIDVSLNRNENVASEWVENDGENILEAEKEKQLEEGVFHHSDSTSISIISWNIQHLGRSKSEEVIYEIAKILRHYDIVAIQEVVAKDPAGAQAVARIADELNRMGFQWDYQVSDPTKSPSVYISERYAFLWKPSRVQMIQRAKLDTELEDLCFREPFVAKFKQKGRNDFFYVMNYHSRKYNDKPEEEIIHFIDYPSRLETNNIIVTGDFNLSETHEVWRPFYRIGFQSALKNQRTTLKWKCQDGNYLNHRIDNFYFDSGIRMISSGGIDFVQNCENLSAARKISDHIPVFMEFRY